MLTAAHNGWSLILPTVVTAYLSLATSKDKDIG